MPGQEIPNPSLRERFASAPRSGRLAATAATLLLAAGGGGMLLSSRDSYKGEKNVPFDEYKVPVFQIGEELGGQEVQVFDKPFPHLLEKEGISDSDFSSSEIRRLEEGDIEDVEKIKESLDAKFASALQMKNGLRVNVFSSGNEPIVVNPQGMADMFDAAIQSIPYMPNSSYKQNALKFYEKAREGKLDNIQLNLIMSTIPNDSVKDDNGTEAIGFFSGPRTSVSGVNRTYHNSTIAASRPAAESNKPDFGTLLHEFGHLITNTTSSDQENATHNDVDTWGVDKGGTNTEHTEFVFPLARLSQIIYERALKNGQAQPAYKYPN
jgi:hypothetical protein